MTWEFSSSLWIVENLRMNHIKFIYPTYCKTTEIWKKKHLRAFYYAEMSPLNFEREKLNTLSYAFFRRIFWNTNCFIVSIFIISNYCIVYLERIQKDQSNSYWIQKPTNPKRPIDKEFISYSLFGNFFLCNNYSQRTTVIFILLAQRRNFMKEKYQILTIELPSFMLIR